MVLSLKERISQRLLKSGVLDQQKLDKALGLQKEKGGKLSQILVDLGYVKQKDLLVTLSQDLNIPLINLAKYTVDPTIIELIPREIARHYQLIPLSKMGSTITIAVADPLNIFAIDDIRSLTGYEVRLMLAGADDIMAAIRHHYSKHTHKEIETVMSGMKEPATIVEEVREKPLDELVSLTQEVPVVKVTNMLLSEATRLKASDILIEPMENSLRIRYRIDGILQDARTLPKEMHDSVVSRIKVISELNIAERRLPQDGRFKIKARGHYIDFRVSTLPTSYGEKVALRILDKSGANLDIEKLGFSPEAMKILKEGSQRPHGMIIVCGPVGSGKTTTLYSILNYVDSPEKNIVTVEEPVEYDIKGINQVNARPEIGLTFAASLRSILRQDPDIIMVGEIRDYETLDIAIKAALTGHLVLSTIHTNSSAGAVTRMINMGLEPFLISSSLIMVAAQRLVRRICTKCKEPFKIDDVVRKRLGIDGVGKQTFYKGKGCRFCLNTGYKGREGIVEALALNSEIRKLIMDEATESVLFQKARELGMTTLKEAGIKKAAQGLTTIDEILRVAGV